MQRYGSRVGIGPGGKCVSEPTPTCDGFVTANQTIICFVFDGANDLISIVVILLILVFATLTRHPSSRSLPGMQVHTSQCSFLAALA